MKAYHFVYLRPIERVEELQGQDVVFKTDTSTWVNGEYGLILQLFADGLLTFLSKSQQQPTINAEGVNDIALLLRKIEETSKGVPVVALIGTDFLTKPDSYGEYAGLKERLERIRGALRDGREDDNAKGPLYDERTEILGRLSELVAPCRIVKYSNQRAPAYVADISEKLIKSGSPYCLLSLIYYPEISGQSYHVYDLGNHNPKTGKMEEDGRVSTPKISKTTRLRIINGEEQGLALLPVTSQMLRFLLPRRMEHGLHSGDSRRSARWGNLEYAAYMAAIGEGPVG